jgi:hypothetical protein
MTGLGSGVASPMTHLESLISEYLEGAYAAVGTYGANVALAFGVRHFDGEGNLAGSFTLNEPTPGSTTGGRTIITGTQVALPRRRCS